jgi:phosphatidylserine decarboxylase
MTTTNFSNKLFILFQYCVPQHIISRLTGRLAQCRIPWLKNFLISRFIDAFNVDMSEAENPDFRSYTHFNHFFTRALKHGARPIHSNLKSIASPADGQISEIGSVELQTLLQAKGKTYTLTQLLGGDSALANEFSNGKFSTIYLSPKDYHRVHMPLDGKLIKTVYVPGKLFSVNQTTANNVPQLFARNERLVCVFETPAGTMAMVLVGAMIVAGIETLWGGQITPQPNCVTTIDYEQAITLKKGDEMGRFKLGSTVIILFSDGSNNWLPELASQSSLKMGQAIGELI